MHFTRYTITAAAFFFLGLLAGSAFGQSGSTLDITKPKEYEERVLQSEREDKKFTTVRRFFQNTGTHYNYFFNANNKLNEVIEKAKASFKDDYSLLLPFYNYSLDATAADSIQLDSVSYKSQSGIALHDLRNDWIDNLYLLWGASYYLRKEFDSAYLMFQYINFAFAEKEKDGYYKTIGSSRDGNSALSIASKEKNSLTRKIFTQPPSRNDAFIWQIRNFLAQDQFAEAASLIVTLRNDPVFPKRLHSDLEEVQAFWFYKQSMWDSAAAHLEKALDNASNKQERARWEYLLAQLYELSGNYDESEKYFSKAIGHTTDPILEVYARLSSIRVNKDGGENYIDKNIAELLRMAKRDKYTDYRDIIYYMAAQMELERNNVEGALPLLLKSTQVASNNPSQRNKAFLQLAELAYAKKQYRQAYNFYDSIRIDDPALKNPETIESRKEMLGKVSFNLEVIERQDSLQRIAALPEDEREDFVKKLVRQIRKQQGLKDESFTTGSSLPPVVAPTLFGSNDARGEWYFYNNNSRQKGLTDFKSRWGNRPNTDNWRRSSAIAAGLQNRNMLPSGGPATAQGGSDQSGPQEATYDGLYSKLPLTPELMKQSNDSVKAAMFILGKAYIQEIEDCAEGVETMEGLRQRFPEFDPMDEVLFNLYYCYQKNGDAAKAAAIKKLMSEKFGNSNYTTIVTTGKNPQTKAGNTEATKTYERIYDLFIEGQFSTAVAEKKKADQQYGNNYWTPQLLYIESVYYVRERNDSTAIGILNTIINRFGDHALAEKARNLIDVLGRRKQIEEELRNLVITRPVETPRKPVVTEPVTQPPPKTERPVVKDTLAAKIEKDTKVNLPAAADSIKSIAQPQVKLPEIKPADKDTTAATPDSILTKTPVQQDSLTTAPPVVLPDTPKDTVAAKTDPAPAREEARPGEFYFAPDVPYYVVLVLNKVDRIFVTEARNAFARYNRDSYAANKLETELSDLDDDNKLLLISSFKTAEEAIDYINRTKPRTATEIIPWLRGGKYTYSIISAHSLDVLKEKKNLDEYSKQLNQRWPGQF